MSTPPRPQRWSFDGRIAGVGSTSGVRVVVGRWDRSPLGAFADAMVQTPDGHRVLLAPRADVAELVAATYTFDEVRVEDVVCDLRQDALVLRSPTLSLTVRVGRRTAAGWALRAVPRRLATAPAWSVVTDPLARVVMRGVRTRGTTGGGDGRRREWYGATDHHRVIGLEGVLDGTPLGALAPVDPPATFGFSSSPRAPSLTRVVSTVEVP